MRLEILFIGVILVGIIGLSGVAGAADTPGVAEFDPDEIDVDSGDSVEIDLTLQVVSTYDDEAVKSIMYTVVYDPEVLSVSDIEQGPWLQGGEETDVSFETDIDTEEGSLTVEQEREPPAGGAVGTGVTATVTFDVAEDAPPSSAVVRYEEYNGEMLEYPLPIHRPSEMRSTIHVDGGGEERDPLADDESDDGPDIITPESEDEPTPESEQADEQTEPESEPEPEPEDQPGFGIVIALTALLTVIGLRRQTT